MGEEVSRKYRQSTQVVIKGHLTKLSSGILGNWQKRFFVLFTDGRLTYFKKQSEFENGSEPVAEINLKYYKDVQERVIPHGSRSFVFEIIPKPMEFNYADIRSYNVCAETLTDMDMWIGAIWQMIEKYQDLKLKLNKLGQVTAESETSVENVRLGAM
eukprot:CFRG6737T1